ncbi:MAG: hypothetical protein EPO28_00770 [Saprospiraceae bacterium]|nr:MAG: hypothetical protein EPO28_00770 [Saprospiraceae bacterium]
MKKLTFILLAALYFLPSGTAQNRDLRFDTKAAMYAANEEWLTFACEVPEGMVELGLEHQSDMYWYSLYSLSNLELQSGLGVHMVSSPLLKKHAKEDKGMPWSKGMMLPMRQRKFMLNSVAQFKAKSGAAQLDNPVFGGYGPPPGAYPVYLEFSGGSPAFVKDPNMEDFATLRWDKKSFDKTMNPAAWGQAMMKEILWARDFFHENRTSKGVTYIGTAALDGAHGFRGAMLIALAMNKSYALKSTLAYNAKTGKLGEVDPMTYDPKNGPVYFPHQYEVSFKGPMTKMMMNMMVPGKAPDWPRKFKVTDNSSDLFDVASLLWGMSEFYYITDPTIKDGFDALFGDAKWLAAGKSEAEINNTLKDPNKTVFPTGDPHMLSNGMTAVNFKNIMALHFNQSKGTLVDTWRPDSKQGNHITTVNAGMAIVALSNVYHRLHDVDMLKNGAQQLLLAQAEFLRFHQDADGSVANGFDVNGKADNSAKTLLSQTFAIRGWLAAYQITKDAKFLDAASKTYDYMQKELWHEGAGVFRSQAGATASTYDGMNYGATLGALRELAIARQGAQRTQIAAQLDKFFYNVANKAGLQIAEINMTGETMPSKKEAADMMAKMAGMKQKDPAKAMAMEQKMMDSDQDGVPKPKFVPGTAKGAAPVTAGSVTIATK